MFGSDLLSERIRASIQTIEQNNVYLLVCLSVLEAVFASCPIFVLLHLHINVRCKTSRVQVIKGALLLYFTPPHIWTLHTVAEPETVTSCSRVQSYLQPFTAPPPSQAAGFTSFCWIISGCSFVHSVSQRVRISCSWIYLSLFRIMKPL